MHTHIASVRHDSGGGYDVWVGHDLPLTSEQHLAAQDAFRSAEACGSMTGELAGMPACTTSVSMTYDEARQWPGHAKRRSTYHAMYGYRFPDETAVSYPVFGRGPSEGGGDTCVCRECHPVPAAVPRFPQHAP